MHNDILAVATIAGDDRQHLKTQQLATRYFCAQFWCEFTKEVLTEFLSEDFAIRQE